jgi:hypothetical protein
MLIKLVHHFILPNGQVLNMWNHQSVLEPPRPSNIKCTCFCAEPDPFQSIRVCCASDFSSSSWRGSGSCSLHDRELHKEPQTTESRDYFKRIYEWLICLSLGWCILSHDRNTPPFPRCLFKRNSAALIKGASNRTWFNIFDLRTFVFCWCRNFGGTQSQKDAWIRENIFDVNCPFAPPCLACGSFPGRTFGIKCSKRRAWSSGDPVSQSRLGNSGSQQISSINISWIRERY